MLMILGFFLSCLLRMGSLTSIHPVQLVTSSSTTPDSATYNNTFREMFASKVLEQHLRYCSRNRLCEHYRPYKCWKCSPCQCDDLCPVFDDCCPDKTLSDTPKPPQTLPPVKCLSNLHGKYTEDEREARYNVSKRFYMVASCPDDTETVLAASCVDSPLLPPVTSHHDNMTYRNRHCAACHGADDTEEWRYQIDCNVFKNFQKLTTPEAVLKFALDQKECWVVHVAPSDAEPRRCYYGDDMISTCNVTGKWPHYDEMLEWACHSYTTVKEVENQTYRNVFCYICNSDNPKLFKCKKFGGTFGTVSFSALLDFSPALYTSTQGLSSKCSHGQLYDGQRDICRDILCSQGKQLVNRTCKSIFGSAKGLGYEMYFDMVSAEELPVSGPEELLRSLPAGLKGYFPYTLDMLITFHDFVVAFNTTDSQGHCSQDAKRLSIYATSLTTNHIEPSVLEFKLLDLRRKNFTFPMESRNISFETMPNENARLISRRHKGRVHKQSSCIISVSMSNPFQSDDPDVVKGTDSSYPLTDDLDLIRVSNLLMCPQIRLEKDEYSFSSSYSGIQLDWQDDILPSGDFEEDDNGVIRICLDDFKPDAMLVGASEEDSEAEVIVSIVCTSLSLVCLFLTFITYCLFKSLRRIPGKNNINLTITLFSAQLMYLVGSGRTENNGLCEAIGIFIHYLWLAVFGAMAVCSFHMFRVFSTLRIREDSSERRRLFLQYCVFVYGMPALLVVATLVVHIIISEGSSIGYGGNRCYLSSGAAIGIAFGIPVALTILVNLVFFILTIRIIRNSPKVDKSKQDEHHAIVYIKLSTLTGITWIVGFVAFAVQWNVLRYIFIVINASQGIFIFISFVCNRRVLRLYSETCCSTNNKGPPKPNAASYTSATKSSTSPNAFTISRTETQLTHIEDKKT